MTTRLSEHRREFFWAVVVWYLLDVVIVQLHVEPAHSRWFALSVPLGASLLLALTIARLIGSRLDLHLTYDYWLPMLVADTRFSRMLRGVLTTKYLDMIDQIAKSADFESKKNFIEHDSTRPLRHTLRSSARRINEFEGYPLLIQRRHLTNRKLPNWTFASPVILDPSHLAVRRVGAEDPEHGPSASPEVRFILEVDLRQERLGVYNNAGKDYLSKLSATKVASGAHPPVHLPDAHKHLLENASTSLNWGNQAGANDYPLRWVSGGVLPLVRFAAPGRNAEWWVALTFRDIPPIGWNISNGLCESPSQAHNVARVIEREMAEELVIVRTGSLDRGSVVNQVSLRERDGKLYGVRPFQRTTLDDHRRRRLEDDGLRFNVVGERNATKYETPFSIVVRDRFHPALPVFGRTWKTKNLIFSINPYEGIEGVQVMKFDLESSEEILDGEVHPCGALLRRPVGQGLGQSRRAGFLLPVTV